MEQALKPEAQGNVAVEPVEWRCDECDCTSYARMDERKPNGGFGPGPLVRCVNCKKVHSVPASSIASLSERLAEVTAQSDRFCDKLEKMRAEMLAEGVNGWPNTVQGVIEHLRAALDPAPGWQTMDSAPRDGTRFLAYPKDGAVDFFHWQSLGYGNAPVGWRDGFIQVYREDDPAGPQAWQPVPSPLPAAPMSQEG